MLGHAVVVEYVAVYRSVIVDDLLYSYQLVRHEGESAFLQNKFR